MYLDESRNTHMGPAHFFFAASFSWQILLLQKHSYKLHLLQTTSMEKQYEANTLHGTFNLPTNQLRWTSTRYYPRLAVSLQTSQFQPLKIILLQTLTKFEHTSPLSPPNLGKYVKSNSKPSECHSPPVLNPINHEKAGPGCPYSKLQCKFHPVFVCKTDKALDLKVSIAFLLIKHLQYHKLFLKYGKKHSWGMACHMLITNGDCSYKTVFIYLYSSSY